MVDFREQTSIVIKFCYTKILVSQIVQFEFRQDLRHYASSSFYATFLSRVKMNSTNWPAPNVWVFIAQLVSTTALSQRGSNPVIVNFQLLKLPLPLRRSYLYLNLYFRSSHHLLSKICVITVCSDRGHLRSLLYQDK